jgi:phage terminase large subunit GpA-like protein
MLPPKLPEGLPSAWKLDCEIFAGAIKPDPDLSITEWADRFRILSPESSAEPGPWRTSRVPYAREIMDTLSPMDPTQEVTFVAGTQVSKTEIGNNFLGFIIDWAPGPVMMVMPTSNTGKRSSKTRLAKMIDAMPRIQEKMSDAARDGANSATLKEFPGGVLIVAGANSAPELKTQPVRYLFEDELDEYPDNVADQGPADELAEKRTDTYVRKKIYRTSTPTRKGRSKIWKHWLKSDQRRYHVPCPRCQASQVLRWDQVRYELRRVWEVVRADDGEIVEVEPGTEGAKARETDEVIDFWYECASCGGRVDEHEKTWMLDRGQWIKGNPRSPRAGFHLPALYSPVGWYSWRTAVEKRLEADRDPTGSLMAAWTNTVLGEPYAEESERVDDLGLKNRAEQYRRGHVPRGALLLTASVDVQAKRLEVKVKGWGRDEESWLVDYQVIFGDTEARSTWAALDEYLRKKFQHEIGAELAILATAVDSGYRTQTVYDFTRRRAHRHIFAVKGVQHPGKSVLGRPSKQDVDHNGEKVPEGVELWPIGVDTAKKKIYARLKIEEPGPGCMHFPVDLPDEYYKQLTAERLVTKYERGYPKRVWEKDETERNEALDLEVYAYAAAIYAGIARVDWDRLEAALIATSSDLFVEARRREERERAQAAAPAVPAPEPETPAPAVPPASEQGGWISSRPGWLSR